MAEKKTGSSEFFRLYGIFIGFIVVFLGIIFGFTFLTPKFYDQGLKESIQQVLEEKYPGKYIVGNKIKINSSIAYSASLYELSCTDSAERNYAVILRSATLYGPMPAVYIYSRKSGSTFAGYSAVKGRVKNLLEENPDDTRINYWNSRLPEIVAASEKKGGK